MPEGCAQINVEKLVADLELDEGFKPYAYEDTEGFLTIGIGTLIDRRAGGGITHEEAVMLCRARVERAMVGLDHALPWWRSLSEARQRVLANMAYNLGVEKLVAFKNTLAAIKRGDYEAAAVGMLDSKWARQVGERARRLAHQMREG